MRAAVGAIGLLVILLAVPFFAGAQFSSTVLPGCPTSPPVCKPDETMYARGDQPCFFDAFFCKKTPIPEPAPVPASSPASRTVAPPAASRSSGSPVSLGLQIGARSSRERAAGTTFS